MDHLFLAVSLFWSTPACDFFTPDQMNSTKEDNRLKFDSNGINPVGVKYKFSWQLNFYGE